MFSKGCVIWITGLSDSGKSTLAKSLSRRLLESDYKVTLLDGDELRRVIGKKVSGFDRETRLNNGFQFSALCKLLADQGHVVIIAVIGLFKELHDWNRKNLPNYFEIYLNTPIEILKERDSKGLYNAYEKGEIKNIYGLDLSFDAPTNPELEIKYNRDLDPDDLVDIVINNLNLNAKNN